ncbi:MAG: heat-inducible transcriptional repressor HrcA [Nitrospinota bacterium]
MSSPDLTQRSQEILRAIVNLFVETGEPVGSRTLSKRAAVACSPATIRNIMSDLAEAGLLSKPHVSAGRMPTDLGYRVYVDGLMDRRGPTPEERLTIQAGYRREILQIEQLLAQASRVLSALTNQAGLVLLPSGEQLQFQHIEFIRMAERQILVVLVAKSGLVQTRIAAIEEDLLQEELDRISRYLSDEYKDLSLREIRQRVVGLMKEDRDNFDALYRRALELSQRAFVEGAEEAAETLVVEGASRVLAQPDFSGDVEKLRGLYRAFEEKSKLVQLLDRCLDSTDVAVFIGAENRIEGMDDCSLIARCLHVGGRPLGTIGVIGPKRMHYDRIISLVDWTADSLTQFIQQGEAR